MYSSLWRKRAFPAIAQARARVSPAALSRPFSCRPSLSAARPTPEVPDEPGSSDAAASPPTEPNGKKAQPGEDGPAASRRPAAGQQGVLPETAADLPVDRRLGGSGRTKPYGSSLKRTLRRLGQQAEDTPAEKLHIPSWFIESNVTTNDLDSLTSADNSGGEKKDSHSTIPTNLESLPTIRLPIKESFDRTRLFECIAHNGKSKATSESTTNQYLDLTLAEVVSSINGSFNEAKGKSKATILQKPNILLRFPFRGGVTVLKEYVDAACKVLGADLIKLDAIDLAELFGPLTHGKGGSIVNSAENIGFETYKPHLFDFYSEPDGEVEEWGEDSSNWPDQWARPVVPEHGAGKVTSKKMGVSVVAVPSFRSVESFTKQLQAGDLPESLSQLLGGLSPSSEGPLDPDGIDKTDNRPFRSKVDRYIDSLLDAATEKRRTNNLVSDSSSSDSGTDRESRTVLLIPNINQLVASPTRGDSLIQKIISAVQQRRQSGQQIVIVGTASSNVWPPGILRHPADPLRFLENVISPIPFKAIFMPPPPDSFPTLEAPKPASRKLPAWELFEKDENLYINLRHICQQFEYISNSSNPQKTQSLQTLKEAIKGTFTERVLSRRVLPSTGVQKLANIIHTLPLPEEGGSNAELVTPESLSQAVAFAELLRDAKIDWLGANKTKVKGKNKSNGEEDTPTDFTAKMEKVEEDANVHEKNLLRGVIDPSKIKTTFENVHAPPETIDAMKTLTSLSLSNPEEFTYGVLAAEKLTGMLLYGPPGTGKTLLAKAVAKESGASVLEVSASEINDMYVGESEKNVRAIFSLARKLSPCVVFIDEADALLAARVQTQTRAHARESLNQFLKEWDGMDDRGVFLMVATNRPFDLDDAVLRRLPRRVLVDLPTMKDREQILRIHLRDERLDGSVDVSELAAQTPFYSGSDLKNMCVAAALASVKETIAKDAAAKEVAEAAKDKDGKEEEEDAKAAQDGAKVAEEGKIDEPSKKTSDEAVVTEEQAENATEADSITSALPEEGAAGTTVAEPTGPAEPATCSSPETALKSEVEAEAEAESSEGEPATAEAEEAEALPAPPARRTLTRAHFETALSEIGASVSEDMASLQAIRKFDEQYGDRGPGAAGRRRKGRGSWGFASEEVGAKKGQEVDAGARVRVR